MAFVEMDFTRGGSSMKEWTLLKSQVGAVAIELPSDYRELIVESEVASGNSYTFHFCKEQVQTTKTFYQGYAWSGSVTANAVAIKFENGTVKTVNAFRNGSDVTSSCKTHVYYR